MKLMLWQAEPLIVQNAIDYALNKYGSIGNIRVKKGVKLECNYPVIEDHLLAYENQIYIEVLC